jgi:hypothetical protein
MLSSLTLDTRVQRGMRLPNPEFRCVLCSKVLDLTIDLNADDNGKAVHEQCYVNRALSKGKRYHEQFPRTFLETAGPAYTAY